jgi:hypothetical protein
VKENCCRVPLLLFGDIVYSAGGWLGWMVIEAVAVAEYPFTLARTLAVCVDTTPCGAV